MKMSRFNENISMEVNQMKAYFDEYDDGDDDGGGDEEDY